MSGSVSTRPRAFAVLFEDLTRWNPGSFVGSALHWSPEHIKPLRSALERKTEEARKDREDFDRLRMVTIRFDGEMEARDGKGTSGIKGKLFLASAGDVVFSKIDVRNGAIGIVPESLPLVAVTSEFPVYEVRKDVALPLYIKLLFRTEFFRRTINGMISGASGRKRVQPEQLVDVDVPLPPLPTQQAIVDCWIHAQERIALAQEQAQGSVREILSSFVRSLGLEPPKSTMRRTSFAVMWQDLARWSVGYNQAAGSMIDLEKGSFPVVPMGTVLEMLQYGTSEKANTVGQGTLVIRMNNIVDGELDLSNMKCVVLPEKTKKTLLLRKGDILINRTNSKELVGKCAVFREEGEYVFASYLIRLRVDNRQILPEYLAYVINSPIGRQQVDALSRQIIGQANINSEELRSLQIPLPPLDTQRNAMKIVADGRGRIGEARESARRIGAEVRATVEALILGAKTTQH